MEELENEESTISPVLASLQNDIKYYNDYIRGLSREVLDSGISKYPIFVAHREKKLGLGASILVHEGLGTSWSINVSALEEFVKKGYIEREKLSDFKASYKDPEEFICVFIITNVEGAFVFLPFPKEQGEEQ